MDGQTMIRQPASQPVIKTNITDDKDPFVTHMDQKETAHPRGDMQNSDIFTVSTSYLMTVWSVSESSIWLWNQHDNFTSM